MHQLLRKKLARKANFFFGNAASMLPAKLPGVVASKTDKAEVGEGAWARVKGPLL